jgi:hypothetical protein
MPPPPPRTRDLPSTISHAAIIPRLAPMTSHSLFFPSTRVSSKLRGSHMFRTATLRIIRPHHQRPAKASAGIFAPHAHGLLVIRDRYPWMSKDRQVGSGKSAFHVLYYLGRHCRQVLILHHPLSLVSLRLSHTSMPASFCSCSRRCCTFHYLQVFLCNPHLQQLDLPS